MPPRLKNFMEQLNRIELCGAVGSVKLSIVNEKRMARFTLATNYAYKDKDGNAVIETTWHNVVAFEGKEVHDLEKLDKGSKVRVTGRLRIQKFAGQDGLDRVHVEVMASKFTLLDDNINFSYEF